MKKEILEWVKSILYVAVVVFIIQLFIIPTTIYHTSMLPTLSPHDMVLVQKSKAIERGDIIVFQTDIPLGKSAIEELPFYRKLFVNENTKKKLIKRVIAGPGDRIEIKGEFVYVNSKLLDELYINNSGNDYILIEEIPKEKYFAMGDNRLVSLDSRNSDIGLIDESMIIGKMLIRILPLRNFGSL